MLHHSLQVLIDLIKSIPQIQQKTDLWHEHRKKIITATDVSTIMNCNPFQELNELFRVKCSLDTSKPHQSDAVNWGNIYEPIAKQLLKARIHHQIVEVIDLGLGTHPEYDYIGASPDGLLITCDDNQWQLWLIEIKCPYKRKISDKIPYDYWLQIQTQLFVWTNLMKRYNLRINGCIYCDNYFDNEYVTNNIHKYYEQYITYNDEFYLSHILPEIQRFKRVIDLTTNSVKERPNKRQKGSLSIDKVFTEYLVTDVINAQKRYGHFVNNELLLDWLDLYGDQKGIQRDQNTDKFIEFTHHLHLELKTKIFNYLISQSKGNNIDIFETDHINTISMEYPRKNVNSLCYRSLVRTYTSLLKNIPIILNAVLYNPNERKIGHFDVIIKSKYLRQLFPQAYIKIMNADLTYDGDTYTFIQIKYVHLKLCAKNTYVLNSSHGHKEYKMEQIHLHKVLEAYDNIPFANYSFISGHHSSFISKRVTYENFNILDSIGLVSPTIRDKKIADDMGKYMKFLNLLRDSGRQWSIDPPSRIELYPNMKNTYDYPWGTYKTQLSNKNKELTLMWNIGTKERNKLDGNLSWDQFDVNKLHYNQHYRNIISNMIRSNMTSQMINIDKPRLDRAKIEFYLDFEFVNHLSDLSDFPICRPVKYIYMIGCICVNHTENNITYHNYLINRLNKEQEQIMLQNWLQDLIVDNQNDHEVTIFHWGNAERSQIESYLNKIITLDDKFNLHVIDLCEMFKTYEIALPNCLSYGLKDVAKSLYKLNVISTTWTTKITGDSTITSIMRAEQECKVGPYTRLCDVPLMKDIMQYNYVDCETLREIVAYLRE